MVQDAVPVPSIAADDLYSTDIPGLAQFCRLLEIPEDRAASRLRGAIEGCRWGGPLADRNYAIERLGRFVVAGPSVPEAERGAVRRLEMLVIALERLPAARLRLSRCIASVLAETSAEKLFAVVGLPNNRGLLAETFDRLAR